MPTHNEQDTDNKTAKERRAHPRHACHEPTFYSTKAGLYEGVIRDRDREGDKGIFISTSEDLLIGQVITVAISSPDENEGKKMKGIIIRREPGGYAVQFARRLNE